MHKTGKWTHKADSKARKKFSHFNQANFCTQVVSHTDGGIKNSRPEGW